MNDVTTYEAFVSLAGQGNVVPVVKEVIADTETPVSVFLKMKAESPYAALLESVEGGENVGRYTFVGSNPFMIFEMRDGRFSIRPRHDDVKTLPSLVSPDMKPLDALKKIFAHCHAVPVEGLPRFTGGAVGYFGYETAALIERIPTAAADDLEIPDALLMFFDNLLVFDAVKRNVTLVSTVYLPDRPGEKLLREEYEKAIREIARLEETLRRPIEGSLAPFRAVGGIERLETKETYSSKVQKAREYIVAGDIFQVVLSQRMRQRVDGDPFSLYRMLRTINPSPYLYYLAMDDLVIVGSSPELLVRVDRGEVQTRPIAGTRRRGVTAQEDASLEKELLADEKERAEHLMLVDLGRNDIGRIAEFSSVEVTEFMAVERYSHVMHIVSNVRGRLRKGLTALDAFFSCFPAGTLSGAPKIRAMEIIAELEGRRRGIYGGAIGYLDFSGNLDACIAIRTVVLKNGYAYFQAGAGIVYDSVPEKEYQETLDKIAASFRAMEGFKGGTVGERKGTP